MRLMNFKRFEKEMNTLMRNIEITINVKFNESQRTEQDAAIREAERGVLHLIKSRCRSLGVNFNYTVGVLNPQESTL